MTTIISVIIPTFNRSELLVRAVQSVLSEGLSNVEIIIVDDASTDNTSDVVSMMSGVRYIRLEKNCGVSHARNIGASVAKGKFLQFLDSDDRIEGGYLRSAIKKIDESDPDLIAMPWMVGSEYQDHHKCIPARAGNILEFRCFLKGGSYIGAAWLWRSNIFNGIGGFREDLSFREDHELFYRAFARGVTMELCDSGAYLYCNEGIDRLTELNKRQCLSAIRAAYIIRDHFISSGHDVKFAKKILQQEIYWVARAVSRLPNSDLYKEMKNELKKAGIHLHKGSFGHIIIASLIGLRNKERLAMTIAALRKKQS